MYRAFGFLVMSCLASSYAVAGLPVPSIEEFAAIVGMAAPPSTEARP
jgi:hypothetical protein